MSTPSRPVRAYGGRSADDRVAERRRGLLDAGLACFGTTGYRATGVKDVCGTAGLTHRYFYESFADKEALFLAVFDEVTDELFAATAASVVAAGGDPTTQLEQAIGTFLRTMADDPRRTRIVFAEPAAVGPPAERHMRRTLRRFADLVEVTARSHLPAAVPDATVRVVALALVGTLERVVAEWQDGRLDLSPEQVIAECVKVFSTLLVGLRVPERPV